MNRLEFIKRSPSFSTQKGYQKSFKKFDKYLDEQNITEQGFLSQLERTDLHERYNILQTLVDSIKVQVSPAVTRNYFDNLFMYFLLKGLPLDYTQKRIRLKFPRVSKARFEGLDEEMITTILTKGSENIQAYISSLVGAGMRETEALKITPSMFQFDEFPSRAKLPAEITKFGIPRETFFPPKPAERIRNIIEKKSIKPKETIFVDNWNENTIIDFEKAFDKIRKDCGYETLDRKPHQQNDITLHSFRAFFITTFEDLNMSSFGHALAGHTKDLSVYYRKSLKERQIQFVKVMYRVDF